MEGVFLASLLVGLFVVVMVAFLFSSGSGLLVGGAGGASFDLALGAPPLKF